MGSVGASRRADREESSVCRDVAEPDGGERDGSDQAGGRECGGAGALSGVYVSWYVPHVLPAVVYVCGSYERVSCCSTARKVWRT